MSWWVEIILFPTVYLQGFPRGTVVKKPLANAEGARDAGGIPGLGRCSIVSDCSDPMDCSLTGSSVHGIFQAKVLIDSYYWAWYMKWWPQGIDSTADKLPLPYVVFRTQHPYGNSGWMPQTIMYLLSPIDNWSSMWPDGGCNLSDMFTSRKQDS